MIKLGRSLIKIRFETDSQFQDRKTLDLLLHVWVIAWHKPTLSNKNNFFWCHTVDASPVFTRFSVTNVKYTNRFSAQGLIFLQWWVHWRKMCRNVKAVVNIAITMECCRNINHKYIYGLGKRDLSISARNSTIAS